MKEFEKWWIKIKAKDYAGIPNYVSARAENLSHINDKEVWKAALEWAKKLCEELDDSFMLDCWCFNIVQNKIDEELEE